MGWAWFSSRFSGLRSQVSGLRSQEQQNLLRIGVKSKLRTILVDFPETCDLTPTFLIRIAPPVLQALDQLPHGLIEGRRNTGLLAPFHDGAVHEIDFGLAFG